MNYIASLDMLMNSITIHIIYTIPFEKTKTLLVRTIYSPSKLKKIRDYLVNKDLDGLANWLKKEYSLQHCQITISLGPVIRDWLFNLKQEKKKGN